MNPFTALPKLLKSKPLVDEIEKDVKIMKPRNWKTTTCGIIAAVVSLAQIWAPKNMQPQIQASAAALVSVGLIAAKDSNN